MKDTHREAFREEAWELLAELETLLLELEKDPGDPEVVGSIFRALHTIKGSGAMFGFDDIAGFTHELESVFDLVRNGRVHATRTLVDLTLASADLIRSMLSAADGAAAVDTAQVDALAHALRAHRAGESAEPDKVPDPSAGACDTFEARVTYRIRFRPHRDILKRGTNPILLLNELRELGECRVVAHVDGVPMLEDLCPEECVTYWDVVLSTRAGLDAIQDVFIFVEEDGELKIDVIDEPVDPVEEPPVRRLGEILIERGDVSQEALEQVLREKKRIGEVLVDAGLVDATHVESALIEQRQVQQNREDRRKEMQASSIRVPADKLDTLVNLAGELVTVQARLSQLASSGSHPELTAIAEELERLAAGVRDSTMSIRMLPIGTTFSQFKRLVRDLSKELGKEITLLADGGETELDKTVIERLHDPLVHIIRNSLDHGIERPETREAAGKPRQGTVHLSAMHAGANVLIRIADDGAGLDKEAILARAVEKGVITADAELSDKEAFALIFAPGFSTSSEITNVSGRGVGMDVVKRSVEALRGSIDVSSRQGIGTTITLQLPLTLAIIDGLLVEVGESTFVMPLSIVEECVELKCKEAGNRHVTMIRDEIVPYIRLREEFRVSGEPPTIEQIVIAGTESGKVGFMVDRVVGEHQTVIKNLGRMYRNSEGITGATILGDGSVALVLDVPKLVQRIESQSL